MACWAEPMPLDDRRPARVQPLNANAFDAKCALIPLRARGCFRAPAPALAVGSLPWSMVLTHLFYSLVRTCERFVLQEWFCDSCQLSTAVAEQRQRITRLLALRGDGDSNGGDDENSKEIYEMLTSETEVREHMHV
eukprot:5721171-Pleurochrysis_carterae.AAC.1